MNKFCGSPGCGPAIAGPDPTFRRGRGTWDLGLASRFRTSDSIAQPCQRCQSLNRSIDLTSFTLALSDLLTLADTSQLTDTVPP